MSFVLVSPLHIFEGDAQIFEIQSEFDFSEYSFDTSTFSAILVSEGIPVQNLPVDSIHISEGKVSLLFEGGVAGNYSIEVTSDVVDVIPHTGLLNF